MGLGGCVTYVTTTKQIVKSRLAGSTLQSNGGSHSVSVPALPVTFEDRLLATYTSSARRELSGRVQSQGVYDLKLSPQLFWGANKCRCCSKSDTISLTVRLAAGSCGRWKTLLPAASIPAR